MKKEKIEFKKCYGQSRRPKATDKVSTYKIMQTFTVSYNFANRFENFARKNSVNKSALAEELITKYMDRKERK